VIRIYRGCLAELEAQSDGIVVKYADVGVVGSATPKGTMTMPSISTGPKDEASPATLRSLSPALVLLALQDPEIVQATLVNMKSKSDNTSFSIICTW
jgi:hypothetical protein